MKENERDWKSGRLPDKWESLNLKTKKTGYWKGVSRIRLRKRSRACHDLALSVQRVLGIGTRQWLAKLYVWHRLPEWDLHCACCALGRIPHEGLVVEFPQVYSKEKANNAFRISRCKEKVWQRGERRVKADWPRRMNEQSKFERDEAGYIE